MNTDGAFPPVSFAMMSWAICFLLLNFVVFSLRFGATIPMHCCGTLTMGYSSSMDFVVISSEVYT